MNFTLFKTLLLLKSSLISFNQQFLDLISYGRLSIVVVHDVYIGAISASLADHKEHETNNFHQLEHSSSKLDPPYPYFVAVGTSCSDVIE